MAVLIIVMAVISYFTAKDINDGLDALYFDRTLTTSRIKC